MRTFIRLFLPALIMLSAVFGTLSPGAAAPEGNETTWDIIDYIEDNSDGSGFYYGFALKQVGGPFLYGYNIEGNNGIYYPASSIKVLHHLHALRWAEANGFDQLGDPIPYYNDSCDLPPNNQAGTRMLSNALFDMMFDSDNVKTNAIQDFFSQAAINATAHNVVGMSGLTQLNHKFGCGGPSNNPANQAILKDMLLLYERYAQGALLGETGMNNFETLMRNEVNSNMFNSVINQQSALLGLTDAQEQAFRAQFNLAYKGGSYDQDLDGDTQTDLFWRSISGVVELPTKTCQGIVTRAYAFGAFIDEVPVLAQGDLAQDVARMLLADEIREALRSFKPVPANTCINNWLSLPPDQGGKLPFQAAGITTTLQINPDSALSGTLRLELLETPELPQLPPRMRLIGKSMIVQATRNGAVQEWRVPSGSSMTSDYNDTQVQDTEESGMGWYWWDAANARWIDAAEQCGGTHRRDVEANRLTAPVCATGRYALLGPGNGHTIFLPMIVK